MKTLSRIFTVAAGAVALTLVGGCVSMRPLANPNPVAYKPHNPGAVRVKVSLSKEQVYVMEGNRPLLIAATCVGLPHTPTHTGHFTVFRKEAHKRSGSYGFYRQGGEIRAAKAGEGSGEYIGYPMPYWVEFEPAYGFHQGYVWPIPHTHGCLRLHQNVAAKFFALVRVGTPVDIAQHQPEDETIGRNVPRPHDFNDPDLPGAYLISSKPFTPPAGPLLQEQ